MDRKITNELVSRSMLHNRTEGLRNAGYSKPKWIAFCEELMKHGYVLELYEARHTYSKYITVKRGDVKFYKVRFSNHKPIKFREERGDCDYFVGRTHLRTTNWLMAIRAVHKHFKYDPAVKTIDEVEKDNPTEIIDATEDDLPWEL